MTHSETILHAYRTGLKKSGNDHHNRKLTARMVKRLRSLWIDFEGSMNAFYAEHGKGVVAITPFIYAVKGKTWKHI